MEPFAVFVMVAGAFLIGFLVGGFVQAAISMARELDRLQAERGVSKDQNKEVVDD